MSFHQNTGTPTASRSSNPGSFRIIFRRSPITGGLSEYQEGGPDPGFFVLRGQKSVVTLGSVEENQTFTHLV